MTEVQAAFRPEFLNRLDAILLFQRLSREHMADIVDIQMARLQARLADRDISLELTDDARTWMVDKGYDPHYGARPLKRIIQNHVQDKLAEALLQGKIRHGETVKIVRTDVPDSLAVNTKDTPFRQTGS
jgi:ATP-dependent Clp protease ATP-binding subunit ClpB